MGTLCLTPVKNSKEVLEGSAADLVAADNNVGANCHILQVAADNLKLTEEQVGCGHKQRLWVTLWRTRCRAASTARLSVYPAANTLLLSAQLSK